MQTFLSIHHRQCPNDVAPAIVTEFFILFVESFDHPIGIKNQSVARPQFDRTRLVADRTINSERHSPHFKFFKRAVRAPENRRIVTGVDVAKAPRLRIVFGKNRGRKALATLTVRARIAIEARHEVHQRCAFARDSS